MYDVINMPDLIIRYFSSNAWLYIFLISLIYLFFRLNRRTKYALLVALVAFILVINSFVIRLFTVLGENSTFYRNLWAIPSMTVVGIAILDLLRLLPKRYLKVFAVVGISVLLWFVNEQEYIRCRDQLFSADAKMVPRDVIEIGDELEKHRDKTGKKVLFVVSPSDYQRSYGDLCTELDLYSGFLKITESSFLTDSSHNGETELSSSTFDIEYIMSKCCTNGIDYVILLRHENTEEYCRNHGYEPDLRTDNYLLYQCKGYIGYAEDVNASGRMIWRSWYDKNRLPMINDEGYCTVEYKYNKQERVILEQFKDTEGNLINNRNGYSYCTWKYSQGLMIEKRYYDAKGNPCLNRGDMYAVCICTYDEKGQLLTVCYYNDKEELVSEKFGEISDESPISLSGYDEIRYLYDDNHNVTYQGYYYKGKLINRKDTGYAVVDRHYDTEGRLVSERFSTKDAEPINDIKLGYHEKRIEYSEDDGEIAVMYYDAEGNPIQSDM